MPDFRAIRHIFDNQFAGFNRVVLLDGFDFRDFDTFTLFHVENGIATQERDFPSISSLFVFFFHPVPVDTWGAVLSFFDVSAELLRLFEREPIGGREFGHGQHEQVNPTIGLFGDKASGFASFAIPRLMPRDFSLLQGFDNPVCDDLVGFIFGRLFALCCLHDCLLLLVYRRFFSFPREKGNRASQNSD